MRRPDVDVVVNACDAGSEGGLIMRPMYGHARCDKKVVRLWVNSMEESAIERCFSMLRDGADYDNLYQSALCRQKADWGAVGLNLSRPFGIIYDAKLRVGRVHTPALAMIAEREARIAAFVKEPHYTASQTLNCVQNLYEQKLCTYPRADSRYVAGDMAPGIPQLVRE